MIDETEPAPTPRPQKNGIHPWAGAVLAARSGADLEQIAAEVLGAAVRVLGAFSGAAVNLREGTAQAVWRCHAADIVTLVRSGGPLTEALARDERWPAGPVVYRPPLRAAEGGRPERGLLVAPVRVRGEARGAMLFFFRGAVPEGNAEMETAAAFAGLLGLAQENAGLVWEARGARESRDHFLTALHHELRTPATALMLDAGILQAGVHGQVPERVAQALQRVEGHAAELIRVAGRVLDLAWLEAGEGPSLSDLVDPRQQVLELLRGIEPSAKRKGLRVSIYLPKALPLLQTDQERFSRVFLHLVSNAIKFTDSGGIEVRLERRVQHAAGGRRDSLAIRVTDTGIGIPAAEMERVFEPFAQVDEGARTDTPSRGLGLGLPLARKLARSLGGDVRIERSGDSGTTLAFLIPYGPTPTDQGER